MRPVLLRWIHRRIDHVDECLSLSTRLLSRRVADLEFSKEQLTTHVANLEARIGRLERDAR